MKNRKLIISLIIILSLLVLVLLILTIGLISGKFRFKHIGFKIKPSNKLVLNEEYNNNFNSVNIDSDAADINIKSIIGSSFRVKIYGDKELMKVEKNENLNIRTKEKSCIGFCFDTNISKIEVYIPENYDGKINIDNNYGDINIDKFENADITILEDSGDIFVKAAKAIKAENKYGDTEVLFGKTVNIKESAGDVSINGADDIIVKNSYGDIEIKKVNNYLNLSNDAGDIEIENLNIKNNSVIKADYGDVEIEKTNKIFIDAKAHFGDVEIIHNYNKSDIILKIENDCGDITIEN